MASFRIINFCFLEKLHLLLKLKGQFLFLFWETLAFPSGNPTCWILCNWNQQDQHCLNVSYPCFNAFGNWIPIFLTLYLDSFGFYFFFFLIKVCNEIMIVHWLCITIMCMNGVGTLEFKGSTGFLGSHFFYLLITYTFFLLKRHRQRRTHTHIVCIFQCDLCVIIFVFASFFFFKVWWL